MTAAVSGRIQAWFDGLLMRLVTGRPLSLANSRKAFTLLFTQAVSAIKAKSFLLLLAKKGETADELLGCLQALRRLERPIGPKIPGLMDTCGTGGDGRHTINVSTLVALVIAGAGGKIAKHGNRAISSRSGSSDLMESLGVKLNASSEKMIRAIRSSGLGYFHAPFHHPVFSKMQSLRRSLKKRTILNLLGPLVNPMHLDYQLVGVSEKRLIPLYAKVLSKLGRRAALVCHSQDGMDEISTSAPTTAAWVTPAKIRMTVIQPNAYGLKKASQKDLAVGSVLESVTRAKRILSGKEKGAARDLIVLNAAYGLLLCGRAKTVRQGIVLAKASLDSGKAWNALQQLKKGSR
ncbi:MAG TPA: anthranilate phosphoribosyltransferase [Candidatus Omnitrophota bacterium]|nr:anthranilate phosphoribosyltransferase [Candidatus Omnitrophota bacterium]